jgi:hypothetical protein
MTQRKAGLTVQPADAEGSSVSSDDESSSDSECESAFLSESESESDPEEKEDEKLKWPSRNDLIREMKMTTDQSKELVEARRRDPKLKKAPFWLERFYRHLRSKKSPLQSANQPKWLHNSPWQIMARELFKLVFCTTTERSRDKPYGTRWYLCRTIDEVCLLAPPWFE